MTPDESAADKVRAMTRASYIRLGKGGDRAPACLPEGATHAGEIYIGYSSGDPAMQAMFAGGTDADWEQVRAKLRENPKGAASATADTNQMRAVVADDGATLWFTFWNRKMYWTFIVPESPLVPWDQGVSRQTIGWRDSDLTGKELETWRITSRISQVQAYQRTVRQYVSRREGDDFDPVVYLHHLILGKPQASQAQAIQFRGALQESLKPLIRLLTESEFENFVDMIFVSDGWQRVSEVGKQQDLIDGEYLHVTSGTKAGVQVKSSTNWSVLNASLTGFRNSPYDYVYWAYHTAGQDFKLKVKTNLTGRTNSAPWYALDDADPQRRLYLLDADMLAKLAIRKGLVDWLIEKAR